MPRESYPLTPIGDIKIQQALTNEVQVLVFRRKSKVSQTIQNVGVLGEVGCITSLLDVMQHPIVTLEM